MQHEPNLKTPDAEAELRQLTEAASGLGRETVDVSGFLQELDEQCRRQLLDLQAVDARTSELSRSSDRMLGAVQMMAHLADDTLERVRKSSQFIQETGTSSQEVAGWVRSVNSKSQNVEQMLADVKNSNTLISDIAWQVHILAVNAKIEAVRAGPAGKRFSIVADSVQDLSQKTTEAAEEITKTVSRLSEWMADLHREAHHTAAKAENVLQRSAENDDALGQIELGIRQLQE